MAGESVRTMFKHSDLEAVGEVKRYKIGLCMADYCRQVYER